VTRSRDVSRCILTFRLSVYISLYFQFRPFLMPSFFPASVIDRGTYAGVVQPRLLCQKPVNLKFSEASGQDPLATHPSSELSTTSFSRGRQTAPFSII
jgi:hypothetical protein